ncbi:hypothetical protein LCGC14_2220460, partial [marine sediment metagenome]
MDHVTVIIALLDFKNPVFIDVPWAETVLIAPVLLALGVGFELAKINGSRGLSRLLYPLAMLGTLKIVSHSYAREQFWRLG